MPIFGWTTDSNIGLFENLVGSVALGLGVGALIETVTLYSPILIPVLIIDGVALLVDSQGFFSGTATDEDLLSFTLDLALV